MWAEKLRISPLVPLVLAVLLMIFPPVLLLAILSAALLHEAGHYAALRWMKGTVKSLSITQFGAEMEVEGRLSYRQELLLAAAGPSVNLLLAAVLSQLGARWELCYLFGGVHLVLGLFNLLPVLPLDGGMLLWNAASWCLGPFTADRISAWVGVSSALLLTGAALWMLWQGGSPFLLLAAFGLLRVPLGQIGLVKRQQRG